MTDPGRMEEATVLVKCFVKQWRALCALLRFLVLYAKKKVSLWISKMPKYSHQECLH